MSEVHPEGTTDAESKGSVSAPAPVKEKKGRNKTVVAIVAALIVVAGLIAAALSTESGALAKLFARDAVVAKVDGASILRSALDERLRQVRGPDASTPPDAAEEQQALDDLVNMRLILNVAEHSDISVSDEEVAAEFESLVQTFGGDKAKLDTQLAAVGITQDQLTENIRQELTIRKVVDANTASDEIAVSDEEVRAYYDANNIANMPEAPSYEELVPFIKDQLTQEKTGVILNEYLEKLKSEAKVELLLK